MAETVEAVVVVAGAAVMFCAVTYMLTAPIDAA